ncbi:MAG: family 78 glycoside hydrolase catalytic domain [Mangrovibacterium sp.]
MLQVLNLRTEYKSNPVGLHSSLPRLSWEIRSAKRQLFQTAWQVKCAAAESDLLSDIHLLWNSGKVESDQSVQVEYRGRSLSSGQRVYWQVKVWDNRGEESEWSRLAFWEMGLLEEADWKAKWIEAEIEENLYGSAPCPFLRREFTLTRPVKKAVAYVSSHGLHELSVNGRKPVDELFTPGWTSYHKRLQVKVYELTGILRNGTNALGVILADGWYRGYLGWEGKRNLYGDKLALLFQLRLEYEDGSEGLVLSDGSWTSSSGPLLQSDIYNGEVYDARLEMPGWNRPGFDDYAWKPVKTADYGYKNLVSSEGLPVRITETLRPVEKIITPKGEQVFDLGQNMVGWVRFRLKGKSGQRIVLSHAEVLDQEGNFYTENLREAKAADTYVFRGEGTECWEPRFTFHGFRYVRVSEYSGKVDLDNLEGRVVHSDMAKTGQFICSDEMVNRLQQNIDWGLRGNFLDVPTDCPQRDERLGWTGDAQVFAPAACFNRDVVNFYGKWMKDFIADQRADGSIPWVIPNMVENGGGTGWSDGFGATGWADAGVIIPWTVYHVYGNRRILEDQYASMKGWEEYMIRESGDSCIFNSGFHFGDWLSFAEYYSYRYNAPDYGYAGAHTDKDLVGTAYFYHTTWLMEKIARILDRQDDAVRYAALQPRIKSAFQKEFMTASGRLSSNTQTAYVLALAFGLVPDELIAVAARRLADDVSYFGHLTTGFLGTPLLCQVLTDYGYPELAFKLLYNKRYPSWLYPITKGATTIWERWDCIKPDGSFQTAGMNSFNHYAYGAVGDWLYSRVAGIRREYGIPAYRRILIKPFLNEKLTYVKACFHSVYGDIVSHWERTENGLKLRVVIPANTEARIALPVPEGTSVREGGTAVKDNPDVSFLPSEGGRLILQVGSGEYLFETD